GRAALDGGFQTPEVYNNLAYSQLGRSDLDGARESLDRALAVAPPLPAACHNRLVLLTQELFRGDPRGLAEVQPALDLALGTCPESAELYGNAADLCAAARRAEPARADHWADLALTHLERGVRLGLRPGTRPTSPLYKKLPEAHAARLAALVK